MRWVIFAEVARTERRTDRQLAKVMTYLFFFL